MATVYAQQRYITSSGTEHWLFVFADKRTGNIIAGWSAPDHPSYGNDPNLPHPFNRYLSIPVPENDEVVLVDIDTTNEVKGLGLQHITENYKVDFSCTIPFKPRDMDGKKVLQTAHPSYSVRRLVKK
jgi:hypothetical protein